MKLSSLTVATLLALGTAVISGTANFVNKFAVSAMRDPVAFTTLKNGLVAVMLIGLMIALRRGAELRGLSRREWFQLVLVGVVGGSIPFALFFLGLAGTTALNAALIHKTLFVWVALLAIPFLNERPTKMQWLGIAVIFAANAVVGGFQGFAYSRAELLILLATLLWAVENVIAKRALASISSATVAAARMIFGSILLLAFVMFFRGGMPLGTMSLSAWGWTLATSILLFGYVTTWYAALKMAPATYVAALLVPATLVTNVLSAIFITHAFSLENALQALLFAVGVGAVVYRGKPESVSPAGARA